MQTRSICRGNETKCLGLNGKQQINSTVLIISIHSDGLGPAVQPNSTFTGLSETNSPFIILSTSVHW